MMAKRYIPIFSFLIRLLVLDFFKEDVDEIHEKLANVLKTPKEYIRSYGCQPRSFSDTLESAPLCFKEIKPEQLW